LELDQSCILEDGTLDETGEQKQNSIASNSFSFRIFRLLSLSPSTLIQTLGPPVLDKQGLRLATFFLEK
jgi:hypothetical protein